MKFKIALLLFALSGSLVGASPLRVKDARGKLITLSGPPQRILSVAPSNTEILYALGLEARIVGVTDYCDYPAQAKQKPRVGGVVLNLEKIVSLKPDLIFAKYDFQKANIEKLEKLGLRVFAVDPMTVEQTLTAVDAIGQATGARTQARRVIARMKHELSLARRIGLRDRKKPRALAIIQQKPLIVVGPKTFLDDAIKTAGGQNVAGDAKQPYPLFSLEAAIARKPEVILLSAAKPQEIYENSIWRITSAVKNRRVYSPAFMGALERPGPRLATAVRQLAELLHPLSSQ